jgi:hypothetical protein
VCIRSDIEYINFSYRMCYLIFIKKFDFGYRRSINMSFAGLLRKMCKNSKITYKNLSNCTYTIANVKNSLVYRIVKVLVNVNMYYMIIFIFIYRTLLLYLYIYTYIKFYFTPSSLTPDYYYYYNYCINYALMLVVMIFFLFQN